jgi:perosamine synthetase
MFQNPTLGRTVIPYGQHTLEEDDIQAVVQVLRQGPIAQGPKIREFEEAVASFVGARYAVAVSSGTAALHLAVLAAGIGSGDSIVTSPNTFLASANCALYVGASPIFSDIDPATLNLDPVPLDDTCEKAKNLRAIIAVHFAGAPCDMPKIRRTADRFKALVVEDAAHALGATYPNGTRIGNCSHSAMTIFSFHPVKLITTGEGGMITTNDLGYTNDYGNYAHTGSLRIQRNTLKGAKPSLRGKKTPGTMKCNTWVLIIA